jgi:hypothetical protein
MDSTPNIHESKGIQAYRWVVLVGLAILGALSIRVLTQIDKTADKLELLQIQVTDMKGTFGTHTQRLDSVDRRIDAHDLKIDDLQRRVWRLPEARTP